jgi:hypothetical protein
MSIPRGIPIAVLLAAGAATGCGGSGASSAASKQAKAEQAALDFARCMRQHGVEVPDPKPGGGHFAIRISVKGGNGPAKLKTAQAACQHFLKGAMAPPSAADRQKMLEAGLKYAACMRKNGVDVPDPSPGEGGIKIGGPGSGPNPDAPAFQRADAKCRTLLPGGGGPRLNSKRGPGPGGPTRGLSVSPAG